MKRKRSITLLEIMIVIFLIGIIGSVIGYNMKGSLDEGKAFKTKEGARRLRDTLLLELAKSGDTDIGDIGQRLNQANFIGNIDEIQKDGWGGGYEVLTQNGEIYIVSNRYITYMTSKNRLNEVPVWMLKP